MTAAAQAFELRRAVLGDEAEVLRLIRALADYEKLAHEVVATEADLRRTLFGERPEAECLLAEVDGRCVGIALYFANYSTFRGRAGIHLEDLFVEPAMRGRGIGKGLLAAVARIAVDRGCPRYEWSVLDWNAPSIEFYRSLGAVGLDEWTMFRLDEAALARVAAMAPPVSRNTDL